MAKILVLTKEGCLPCIRIKRIMNDLRGEIAGLDVEEVDFSSQEGMKLAIEHQILYPPAVLVNGQVFKGKIPEDELKGAVRSSVAADIRG
ncbi:MAG: hypothetical protein LYZ66_03605 [Nitrososphaerales archaeon]|nr:hypothetical protein [Nitrososphaerales archaeon]